MIFSELISKLSQNPKRLFLIDGIGAILSAFLLGIVLVQLESYVGMPRNTLYILAVIPCFFAVYDLYCYQSVSENWRIYIKGIAYANLGYCVLSVGMLFVHYQKLTYLGLGYFVLEIIIVILIAVIELRAASRLDQ